MSYPTGGSGYNAPTPPSSSPAPSSASSFGQQPAGSSGAGSGSSAAGSKGLPFYLTAGTTALGIINFLLGFTTYASLKSSAGLGVSVSADASFFESRLASLLAFLLLGGIFAALGLLPKNEKSWTGAAAAASLTGFIALLFQSFALGDNVSLGWGAWVVLFLALVQSAAAVAALLFETGVLSQPAPKPKKPAASAGFGGTGGYPQQGYAQGQQGGYGQYGHQYGQSQPGQVQQGQAAGQQSHPGYPQQSPYGQYGQQQGYAQGQYGQQPSPYGQPGQPGQPQAYGQQQAYGAAGGQAAPGAQQSPYGQPAQSGGDDAATQHIGSPAATQQPYGAPNFGQQPGQGGQAGGTSPFGSEQTGNPAADATKAYRPEDDKK
ncbi:MAG: DUF5336 domain-containing protein [Nocardia sp.]|nr:DUF5336 domain-containing protein [Nocardia sp.]